MFKHKVKIILLTILVAIIAVLVISYFLDPDRKVCLGEGEIMGHYTDKHCCSGLKLIPSPSDEFMGFKGICTAKCGDGFCDNRFEDNGESARNCPEDCQKKPVPDTNINDDSLNRERNCITSGGAVSQQSCCLSASDFPNNCLIGACSCSPDYSHTIKSCDCGEGKCFDGKTCINRSFE